MLQLARSPSRAQARYLLALQVNNFLVSPALWVSESRLQELWADMQHTASFMSDYTICRVTQSLLRTRGTFPPASETLRQITTRLEWLTQLYKFTAEVDNHEEAECLSFFTDFPLLVEASQRAPNLLYGTIRWTHFGYNWADCGGCRHAPDLLCT